MAFQGVQFQNFSGEDCPRTPLKVSAYGAHLRAFRTQVPAGLQVKTGQERACSLFNIRSKSAEFSATPTVNYTLTCYYITVCQ